MDEATPTRPVNAYGASKLAVDRMIADECRAHGLGAVSLRYFNVAGASGGLGEDHEPETHLIPNVLRAAPGAAATRVQVFGTDYPTPDGTAVRDYIHIEDLGERPPARARAAREPGEHRIFNLGNGNGFSVREVIEAAREVTGLRDPRRGGAAPPGRPAAARRRERPDPRRARAGSRASRRSTTWSATPGRSRRRTRTATPARPPRSRRRSAADARSGARAPPHFGENPLLWGNDLLGERSKGG